MYFYKHVTVQKIYGICNIIDLLAISKRISANGNSILPVAQTKNLGTTLDSFSITLHIPAVSKSYWFNFQNLSESPTTYYYLLCHDLVQLTIIPLLDYCRSLLTCIPPSPLALHLFPQSILSMATKVILTGNLNFCVPWTPLGA